MSDDKHQLSVLVVPGDAAYVDARLATASWYDRYVVKAGRYPVTVDGAGGAGCSVTVDAALTERHRVNGLLSETREVTERMQERTQLTLRPYDFQAAAGRPILHRPAERGEGFLPVPQAHFEAADAT